MIHMSLFRGRINKDVVYESNVKPANILKSMSLIRPASPYGSTQSAKDTLNPEMSFTATRQTQDVH